MSIFASIESQLVELSTAYRAVLTRNRNGQSLRPAGPNMASFEERRIDWQREGLNLALIIQPDFLVTGVDTSKWNFRAVVWQGNGHRKLTAGQDFVTSMPFQHIEEQIDDLLVKACDYLNSIQMSDLEPMPYLREQGGKTNAGE
jgi:hypothetical protein